MKKPAYLIVIILVGLMSIQIACNSASSPSTPQPPTNTPTPTLTTISGTLTDTPTGSPTPTVTQTASPTSTPIPIGNDSPVYSYNPFMAQYSNFDIMALAITLSSPATIHTISCYPQVFVANSYDFNMYVGVLGVTVIGGSQQAVLVPGSCATTQITGTASASGQTVVNSLYNFSLSVPVFISPGIYLLAFETHSNSGNNPSARLGMSSSPPTNAFYNWLGCTSPTQTCFSNVTLLFGTAVSQVVLPIIYAN